MTTKKSVSKKRNSAKTAIGKHLGSTLKSFLREQGIEKSVNAKAKKLVASDDLQRSINKKLTRFKNISTAKNKKTGKLLTLDEMTARMISTLNEAEKNMLRKRFGV